MVGQHRDQLLLDLRLEQRVDRAGRQLGERGIGRREHGEGAGSLQRLDQARGLDRGDQRGVVLRVHRVLDDVLRGIHRSAADRDGLLLHLRESRRRRDGGEGERRRGDGGRQDRAFAGHVVSPSVAPRQRLAMGDTQRAKRGCSAGMGIFDRRGMPARGRSPLRQ